jgi:hypothetical protein
MSTVEVTRRYQELRDQFREAGVTEAITPFIRWKYPELTAEQAKSLSRAFAGRCTRKDADLIPVVEKVLQQIAA